MTQTVRKALQEAVLAASQADTWEQARKEWSEVSLIFNGIGRSNCVCGNAIKYSYELFNGVTGQRLFPIGSECVRHFQKGSLLKQLEKEEKLLQKLERLAKKAQQKGKMQVARQDFDEQLLAWFWEQGVFKAHRGNQFSPQKDYQLFLEVFRGESWSKANPAKKAQLDTVLERFIKPFLLGKQDEQLYLKKLGREKLDYEQDLRIKAEKERRRRDKIAKQYADNLVLAMGPAERAYQDYFGLTEALTRDERQWEKVLFGKNRAERMVKTKQAQKEFEKTQRILEQDSTERRKKQVWLLQHHFQKHPKDKEPFTLLLSHYRKTGRIPFTEEVLTPDLIAFFYKMKVFEFEISPEKIHQFLSESLTENPLSSAKQLWIDGILTNCLQPFLERLLI